MSSGVSNADLAKKLNLLNAAVARIETRLNEIHLPRYLMQNQVAEILGVSRWTVARLVKNGKFAKPVIIDGKPKYRETDVNKFLREHGSD